MAVTVVGGWELSWNSPIKEADLWELPLRDFEVSDWWMWPVSGIRNTQRAVTLSERGSLLDVLDEVQGTRVFVEPRNPVFEQTMNSEWLHEFEHPEDAVYIFGTAGHNPVVQAWKPGDLIVSLETMENKGVLWPHQVLVTVLHDRLVKSWQ